MVRDEIEALVTVDSEAEQEVEVQGDLRLEVSADSEGIDSQVELDPVRGEGERLREREVDLSGVSVEDRGGRDVVLVVQLELDVGADEGTRRAGIAARNDSVPVQIRQEANAVEEVEDALPDQLLQPFEV